MDFFEHFLHIAPDGGTGSTETTLLVGCLALIALAVRAVLAVKENR